MVARDCPSATHYSIFNIVRDRLFGIPPNAKYTGHSGIMRSQNRFEYDKVQSYYNRVRLW